MGLKSVGSNEAAALDLIELAQVLPMAKEWIANLLTRHRHAATSVASFGFKRLPDYFTKETLERARVVLLDSVPKPPLSAWGLSGMADFEAQEDDGITFQNMYFLKPSRAADESLHLHELIHTIQWQVLGSEQFLLAYAQGHLAYRGYAGNPLERIAFDLQRRFQQSPVAFGVEPLVLEHLGQTISGFAARARSGSNP
jgi:hypothetical protein